MLRLERPRTPPWEVASRTVTRPRGRRLAAAAIVAVALLVPAGCADTPTSPGPDPRFSLVDGADGDGGNPHFFFLKPRLTPPASFPGEFDVRAEPTVTVCEWSGSACAQAIATFTSQPGRGAGWIRMDAAAEQFAVNWKTRDAALDPAKSYRVTVALAGVELGHVDLDPVSSGRDLRNVNTGEYVGLLDGTTLPIRFRIERDALLGRGIPVGAGGRTSCALDPAGHAWCWGSNFAGQLGRGTTSSFEGTPAEVLGGHVFVAVSVSGASTCGLTANGEAWCWGYNGSGALGTGSTTPATIASPVRVSGSYRFRTLSVGGGHACGLSEQGEAVCWGFNGTGALGRGTAGGAEPTPAAVPGLTFTALSAGQAQTCGVATDGRTLCWGDNMYLQLGVGGLGVQPNTTPTWPLVYPTPTPIVSDPGFVEVRTGQTVTCGRTAAGVVHCWGYNNFGALGRGPENPTFAYPPDYWAIGSPAPLFGSTTFTAVTVGGFHACGLAEDQTARCWGLSWWGQLGDGTTSRSFVPVVVNGGQHFLALAAGAYHTCGLDASGFVFCWGENEGAQIGTGAMSFMSYPLPYSVGGGFEGLTTFTP